MEIIVYHSPIGGAGKTTLALTHAYKLHEQGSKVLILDMASYGTINHILKESNTLTGIGRIKALFEVDFEGSIDSVVEEIHENGIKKIHQSNRLFFLSAATLLKMEYLEYAQTQRLFQALNEMDFDAVIVDTSSDLHIRNIACLEAASKVFVPITQNLVDTFQVEVMLNLCSELHLNTDKFALIINKFTKRVYFNKNEVADFLKLRINSIVLDKSISITNFYNTVSKTTLNKSHSNLGMLRKYMGVKG